jgi:transposase
MDMWLPYREAVRTFLPSAFIVVDKFHVLRMVNASLDAVRKSIREDLSKKRRREDRFYYVSSTDSDSPTINYGVDISTLLRLMDEGMF